MNGTDSIAVVENGSDSVQLALKGQVTIREVKNLHQAATKIASRHTNVTISCASAESLDTATLQVLLCLGREVIRTGKACEITGVPGHLREVFRLAGLADALPPEPACTVGASGS
jgi:anti-anti-sigma factor